MRKILTAIVGTVFVISTLALAEAQNQKFAFFNPIKLQERSVKAKELMKKFQDSVELKKANLEKKQKAYLALKESVDKAQTLKDDAQIDKLKQLKNLEYDIQIEEQRAKESLQAEQQEMMQIVQADIAKIIKKIREERGYTFIFNVQALMAADESLDISDEVIKAFDSGAIPAATAPKPKPAAPAAAPAGPAKPKPPAGR
jgi:Skp family chaperone for outer membrane proteins